MLACRGSNFIIHEELPFAAAGKSNTVSFTLKMIFLQNKGSVSYFAHLCRKGQLQVNRPPESMSLSYCCYGYL